MKKHITARRERNRQLAEQDAAKRCRICRRERTVSHWIPFCSQECELIAEERRVAALEARR